MRRIVLYIVYGDCEVYYDGAKFSLLTYLNWVSEKNNEEIVILTEKPHEFSNYPVTLFKISENQKQKWSLNGKYHFRIKNRGLSYVIEKLSLKNDDKLLFFDTDTYFFKSPLKLFNLINSTQALLYMNEGLIYRKKRFNTFVKSLDNKIIMINNFSYSLTEQSSMWGTLMIGIMPNMIESIELADKLMLEFFETIQAHTIEQFALSEVLSKKYKLVEGKKYISLYSTSGKKEYAKDILRNFFIENSALEINEQINNAQKVNIKRSLLFIIRKYISKYKNV